VQQTGIRRQIQSVFATTTFDYDEKVYLDMTVRNDWASSLAFTPKEKTGYMYISSGINAVVSEMVQLPAFINYGKLRFSYARVGNDVEPFSTLPTNIINSGTNQSIQTGAYKGSYLQPEDARSFEAGTEWRLINNRLTLDFTWYQTHTREQEILRTRVLSWPSPMM
jgi:outer membrane receptor for monomeric catechols